MSAYLTSVCGDLGKYLRLIPHDMLLHSVYMIRDGPDTLKVRIPLIDKDDSQCVEDELENNFPFTMSVECTRTHLTIHSFVR